MICHMVKVYSSHVSTRSSSAELMNAGHSKYSGLATSSITVPRHSHLTANWRFPWAKINGSIVGKCVVRTGVNIMCPERLRGARQPNYRLCELEEQIIGELFRASSYPASPAAGTLQLPRSSAIARYAMVLAGLVNVPQVIPPRDVQAMHE